MGDQVMYIPVWTCGHPLTLGGRRARRSEEGTDLAVPPGVAVHGAHSDRLLNARRYPSQGRGNAGSSCECARSLWRRAEIGPHGTPVPRADPTARRPPRTKLPRTSLGCTEPAKRI